MKYNKALQRTFFDVSPFVASASLQLATKASPQKIPLNAALNS